MKSFIAWDGLEIAYREWSEEDPMAVRPEVLARAIPDATLRTLSGNHIGALADPRFTRSIIDFLA